MDKVHTKVRKKSAKSDVVRVNIDLDAAVLAYFKRQAGTRSYQVLINEALKEVVLAREALSLAERVDEVYGKFAFLPTSSDEFAKRKQAEIELEG